MIQGKRIRNFDKHFNYLKHGQKVVFGVRDASRFTSALSKVGFPADASIGATVLPSSNCGPVCRYNAEGKAVVRRDLPKETHVRLIMGTRIEWHGPRQVEVTDPTYRSYERYPRELILPPSVEISLLTGIDGVLLAVGPTQTVNLADTTECLHTVNVLLEIFGECQVFTEEKAEIIQAPLSRLNWKILPQGQRPWEKLREEIEPLMKQLPERKRTVASFRFQEINTHGPDFMASGEGGFGGYVVFGFKGKNLYLCESMYTGNATYVFAEDWQQLSQMTKAEILNGELHEQRLIHNERWTLSVRNLLT